MDVRRSMTTAAAGLLVAVPAVLFPGTGGGPSPEDEEPGSLETSETRPSIVAGGDVDARGTAETEDDDGTDDDDETTMLRVRDPEDPSGTFGAHGATDADGTGLGGSDDGTDADGSGDSGGDDGTGSEPSDDGTGDDPDDGDAGGDPDTGDDGTDSGDGGSDDGDSSDGPSADAGAGLSGGVGA